MPNPDTPPSPIKSASVTDHKLTNSSVINNNGSTDETQTIIVEKSGYLQWVFLSLWILTALAWFGHIMYLKRKTLHNTNRVKFKYVNNNYLALMAACKQNNAEKALSLILPWLNNINAQANDVEISSLAVAVEMINEESFTQAINDIQQHLYGKSAKESKWVGESLLKVIQHINKAGVPTVPSNKFTLNPK